MALKILSTIGTDRGVTNEAYLRIADYTVNKNQGNCSFRLQLFNSEADSVPSSNMFPFYSTGLEARSQVIGDYLNVSLMVEEQVETENGPVINQVVDLSPLENVSIFEFGYTKLKEKLKATFGDENVVDC